MARPVVAVTEEIIAAAIPRNSGHCMVADAIKEAYPDAKYISVDLQSIRFSDMKTRKRHFYFTPRKVQQPLVDFDQGKTPTPFQFKLPATPAQTVQVGAGNKKGDTINDVNRKKLGARKEDEGHGWVPTVEGGQLPPTGSGLRREFGLRGFGR